MWQMPGQQFWWSHLFREWKSTAYCLIFPENLVMYLSVSSPLHLSNPICVHSKHLSYWKAGLCFYAVCFLRHQDLQRAEHNWDDCFHTEVLLHGLCFSILRFYFKYSLHSYRYIYILEVWLHDDNWNSISRRHLSYVYISKWCGWVGMYLCTGMFGAENLMSV